MNVKASKNEPKDAKLFIIIVAVIMVVIGVFLVSRPKRKAINLSNLPQKELKSKPEAVAPVAAPSILGDDGMSGDGIISFEMYPNPKKAKAAASEGTSREALVRFVLQAVSGIEDDLAAKNAVIAQVSGLSFRMTGAEFLELLKQAAIGDEFYYMSTVKSVAPLLKYPLTEEEFTSIIAGVTDMGYQFKLRTILGREQARNAIP